MRPCLRTCAGRPAAKKTSAPGGQHRRAWARALLAALLTLLVYVVFSRFFIRDLLAGSVKW
jgi:ABC-type glycerol-3-phosphate transport system permease component